LNTDLAHELDGIVKSCRARSTLVGLLQRFGNTDRRSASRLNFMLCPLDQSTLAITDRQGIEIDYCPKCRGVWLDRGELDKLIETGSRAYSSSTRDDERPKYEERPPSSDSRYDYQKKKKKESFLKDLFDF
jgi:uncharacterized protein